MNDARLGARRSFPTTFPSPSSEICFRATAATARGISTCSTRSTRALSVSTVSSLNTGTGHCAMIGP